MARGRALAKNVIINLRGWSCVISNKPRIWRNRYSIGRGFCSIRIGKYDSLQKAIQMAFLRKSNISNTAAAAADSLIFPAIAFGVWMPVVVILQFSAKVGGGFFGHWL